jgi:hypothetical protein
VLDSLPGRELLHRDVQILEEFRPLNQALVLINVQKDRRSAPMLGEDKRATCAPNLLDKSGRVRPKFREGTDVLAEVRTDHGSLLMSVHLYVRYNVPLARGAFKADPCPTAT